MGGGEERGVEEEGWGEEVALGFKQAELKSWRGHLPVM